MNTRLPVALVLMTIAAMLGMLTAMPGFACPRSEAETKGTTVGNGSQVASEPVGEGDRFGHAIALSSDVASNDVVVTPEDQSLRLILAAMMGGSLVIGLFAIAVMVKVRQSQDLSAIEADLWHRYPELAHPELVLAPVPKEAFAVASLDEGIQRR